LLEYKIELIDTQTKPFSQPLRKHPVAFNQLIDDEIDRLLSAGIVSPCKSSAWCSNIVLVKRKSLPGQPTRMRITVDLRGANAKIKKLQYPLCDTASVIDSLASFSYYSSLGFCNAYLAIKIHPSTRDITAFCTRKNLYSFNRLPQEYRQVRRSSHNWCS
jgi:hypothetical protein